MLMFVHTQKYTEKAGWKTPGFSTPLFFFSLLHKILTVHYLPIASGDGIFCVQPP